MKTRPDGFTGEIHQTIKEEITTNLLKFFQKNWAGGALSSSIHEGRITMIPKPDKSYKKRKL